MNRYIYLCIISLGLLFTACDESFLDLKSPDELTGESFWRNQTDAEAGLAAAYSHLECATDYWAFAEIKFPVELFTSDLVKLGNDPYNYENWLSIHTFTVNEGNTQISSYWNLNYRGINYSNQVIEKVAAIADDKIKPEVRNIIVAEARFLRAYYHLKLLLNWKDIVLKKSYPKGISDIDIPLSNRSECWDFIIADFKAAAANLPTKFDADNVGRATKWAALSYLGKANLFRSGEDGANASKYLQEAKTAFAEVVNGATANNIGLVDDYLSMFNGTNQNSKEAIFALQLSPNTDNSAWYKFPYHRWLKPAGLGGWDEICGSDFLLQEFKKEGKVATDGRYDHRLYATLFFEDEWFNDAANPRVYGYTFNEWWDYNKTPRTKTGFRKYLPATKAKLDSKAIGNNIPLMRYADVLLMYAETLNNLGESATAVPLINQVRARAGMPAMKGSSKADIQTQIEHERICELAMESARFYDLRRWGKAVSVLSAKGREGINEATLFFPIPESEKNSNNKIN